MIFTPASTSWSASSWAAAVGTARTPTTMSSSSTIWRRSSGWRTVAGPTCSPILASVGVEDRHDAEAVVGEDVRGGDRLAEVAGAEQRDVVLAGGAQDLADLRDQRVDVVAHAALAELAEAGQVAADLRGVDVRVLGQLLGGDRLLAHLARLGEHLQVAREARGHAERQPIGAGPPSPGAAPPPEGVATSPKPIAALTIEPGGAAARPRPPRSRTAPRRRGSRRGSARGSA